MPILQEIIQTNANHVRRGSGKKILLNTKIHFTFLNFTSIALLKLFFPQECQIKSDLLRIDGYTWLGLDSTGQSTGRANIKSPFRSKTFAYFGLHALQSFIHIRTNEFGTFAVYGPIWLSGQYFFL